MRDVGDAWKLVRLELEIDRAVVQSKMVYKGLYDWEFKKMRLRAIAQKLPWVIYKTVTRGKNSVPGNTVYRKS